MKSGPEDARPAYRWLERLQTFLPPVLVCVSVLSLPLLPPACVRLGAGRLETPAAVVEPVPARLHDIREGSARKLLERLDRVWDHVTGVPLLAPRRLPEDLAALGVAERKRVFLRAVAPHVLQRTQRLRTHRVQLQETAARFGRGEQLRPEEEDFVATLARDYRVQLSAMDVAEALAVLLRRVDEIPPSLALAQAALESGWGTSRFSRQGNNLFGQWVFDRDKGMAPLQRPDGADYSVARYPSLGDAVDAYLLNLNRFYAYAELRRLRREMRLAREPLDSLRLADGLRRYSTRGEEYVREVRAVIRANQLTRFDHMDLVALPPQLLLHGDSL